MEIWKDIKGYEGLYQVSNYGRVKSLPRKGTGRGKSYFIKGGLLKFDKSNNGYLRVLLCNNSLLKRFLVHRLVAFAFPEICGEWFEGAVVNHKDENKQNNYAENLEWCTTDYNNKYGDRLNKIQKPIIQYSLDGNIINSFKSIKDAEKYLNIRYSGNNIITCLKGKQKTAYGYIWRYENKPI